MIEYQNFQKEGLKKIRSKYVIEKRLIVLATYMKLCSGVGYITSSNVSSLLGGWQWGLRVTPFIGVLCILFVILVMKEPKRGEAENVAVNSLQKMSYWEDIKAICKM